MVYLRLRLVGLPSAGYGVAHTSTRGRVHRLHDDEGSLLQGGDGQMPVIRHRLQVGAEPRPHRVSHLQDAHLIGPHLRESKRGGQQEKEISAKQQMAAMMLICYSSNTNRSKETCEGRHTHNHAHRPSSFYIGLSADRRLFTEGGGVNKRQTVLQGIL